MSSQRDMLKQLKAEKLRRKCSSDLWEYIITMTPKVYDNDDRRRLFKGLADYITVYFKKYDILESKDLDDLTDEQKQELINHISINLATFPRAGKSFFIAHFVSWILGNYPEVKIIMVSRSDELASSFIRNICNLMRKSQYKIIFPNVEIETENATEIGVRRVGSNLKNVRSVYATGIFGQITGFGANIMILDDIYKNHEEAFSDVINKKIKQTYYSAIETRMEGVNRLEVHIGTRWSTNELFAVFEGDGFYDKIIKTPSFDEEKQQSLYPTIHNTDKLLRVKKDNKIIFQSAYQQQAIDEQIRLFPESDLRVVSSFPAGSSNRFVVIDPGDGGDYTSVGWFANQRDGTDALEWVTYKNEPITDTIAEILKYVLYLQPRIIYVETNNDKTCFYKLTEVLVNSGIVVQAFKTTTNKHSKIFNQSGNIKNRTLFNDRYKGRGQYKEFMDSLKSFHVGTKEHDDAADMLAMKELLTYNNREFLGELMKYTYK